MNRTLLAGGVIAFVAALVALLGDTLNLTSPWPVLLAAAVGLATAPTLGRGAAFLAGAATAWLVAALRAGVLPDVVIAGALLVAFAVVLLTVVALVSRDRLPLWTSLLGFAAFTALYDPLYASAPTAFLSESPVAFVTVLLAASIGFLAATAAANLAVAPDADEVVRIPDEPAFAAEVEA